MLQGLNLSLFSSGSIAFCIIAVVVTFAWEYLYSFFEHLSMCFLNKRSIPCVGDHQEALNIDRNTFLLPCPLGCEQAVADLLRLNITEVEISTTNGLGLITDKYLETNKSAVPQCFIEHLYSSVSCSDFEAGSTIVGVIQLRAINQVRRLLQRHSGSLNSSNSDDGYLIDIGGGDGRKSFATAALLQWPVKRTRVWEIVLCEPRNSYIDTLLHNSDVPFVCSEGTRKQGDKSVSIALLLHVMHHIPDDEHIFTLLRRLQSCMCDGGLLVVREHDCDPTAQEVLAQAIQDMHTIMDIEGRPMSPPRRMHSRLQWELMLKGFGFYKLLPEEPLHLQETRQEFNIPDPKVSRNATFMDVYEFREQ